jgi:predicted nucleic acid-binding protein
LTGIVTDASVALAWCFPDEASEYADRILVALEGHAILVPALRSVEITNALLMAERRKRVKPPEIRRFVELLDGLTVIIDSQSVTESVSNILPIAREYGLSAYDAAYLDVAVRHGAPLATLDSALRKAGQKAGIEIFGGSVT